MVSYAHIGPAISQHGAPFGTWRLCAETDEGQGSGCQNGGAYTHRKIDDDVWQGAGQDMTKHDNAISHADGPRCIDIDGSLQLQRRTARKSGKTGIEKIATA